MAVGVSNCSQVVFGVVGVLRDISCRVLDGGQAVGVVVGIGGRFAILIPDRDATAAVVVAELGGGGIGIGNPGETVQGIIGKGGRIAEGIL